jgi:hypothetical protein
MFFDAWSEDLIAALGEPFAAEDHKSKRQGGQEITFVDVHKYKERLNATVGPHGWSSAVRLEPVGGKLICTVALTVLGVTKENVGDEVEVPELNERGNEKIIGSPATNSYAQAFKRCCSDFGLGDYLYDEARRSAAAGKRPARSQSGNDRSQSGNGDKASDAQLGLIKRLMASMAVTQIERDGIQKRIGAGMTKKQASEAIEWLNDAIEKRGVPV